MNAYLIRSADYFRPEYLDGWMIHPGGDAEQLVFAHTRGLARARFLNEYDLLKWTDSISIRLLAKDVDRSAGFAGPNDEYWFAAMARKTS